MKYIIKALLIAGLVAAALIFYFFYSTHSNYYQGVRAAESYKHANTVAASISKYYLMHLKYPDSIDELNLEKSQQHHVGKIIFDNQAGVIKIQLAGESSNEGSLIFFPQIKYNNELSYICHPLDVPTKYTPKECAPKKPNSNSSP